MAIGKARRWIANFISGGLIDGFEEKLHIITGSRRHWKRVAETAHKDADTARAQAAYLQAELDALRPKPKPKLTPLRDATGRFAKRTDIEWSGYAETMD